MKRFIRPAIVVLISLALALTSAAATRLFLLPGTGNNLSAAAFFLQTTPTPEQVDRSEIGSTDGIVVMGFLLAVIVLVPILLRRKAWSQSQ
jgi:hypothetical protein